jgi:hypothetical protein
MLVGAYAVAAHGLPRATGDIDLWVECSEKNANRVWAALSDFGAPLGNLSKQDFLTPGTVVQSLGLKKCKKGKNEIKYAIYHLCSQSHTSTHAHNVRRQDHHHRSTSRRDAKEVREVVVQDGDLRAEDDEHR